MRPIGRRTLGALVAVILAVSLILLWHHTRMIELGYRTEALRTEKARMERVHRELVIERENLASLERIERLASNLGLMHLALRDTALVRVDLAPHPREADEHFAVAFGRGLLPAEVHAAP